MDDSAFSNMLYRQHPSDRIKQSPEELLLSSNVKCHEELVYIASCLLRTIEIATKVQKRKATFRDEIRRKIILLNDCLSEYYNAKNRYPKSSSFLDLLSSYVILEVQRFACQPEQNEETKHTESQILCLLQTFHCRNNTKKADKFALCVLRRASISSLSHATNPVLNRMITKMMDKLQISSHLNNKLNLPFHELSNLLGNLLYSSEDNESGSEGSEIEEFDDIKDDIKTDSDPGSPMLDEHEINLQEISKKTDEIVILSDDDDTEASKSVAYKLKHGLPLCTVELLDSDDEVTVNNNVNKESSNQKNSSQKRSFFDNNITDCFSFGSQIVNSKPIEDTIILLDDDDDEIVPVSATSSAKEPTSNAVTETNTVKSCKDAATITETCFISNNAIVQTVDMESELNASNAEKTSSNSSKTDYIANDSENSIGSTSEASEKIDICVEKSSCLNNTTIVSESIEIAPVADETSKEGTTNCKENASSVNESVSSNKNIENLESDTSDSNKKFVITVKKSFLKSAIICNDESSLCDILNQCEKCPSAEKHQAIPINDPVVLESDCNVQSMDSITSDETKKDNNAPSISEKCKIVQETVKASEEKVLESDKESAIINTVCINDDNLLQRSIAAPVNDGNSVVDTAKPAEIEKATEKELFEDMLFENEVNDDEPSPVFSPLMEDLQSEPEYTKNTVKKATEKPKKSKRRGRRRKFAVRSCEEITEKPTTNNDTNPNISHCNSLVKKINGSEKNLAPERIYEDISELVPSKIKANTESNKIGQENDASTESKSIKEHVDSTQKSAGTQENNDEKSENNRKKHLKELLQSTIKGFYAAKHLESEQADIPNENTELNSESANCNNNSSVENVEVCNGDKDLTVSDVNTATNVNTTDDSVECTNIDNTIVKVATEKDPEELTVLCTTDIVESSTTVLSENISSSILLQEKIVTDNTLALPEVEKAILTEDMLNIEVANEEIVQDTELCEPINLSSDNLAQNLLNCEVAKHQEISLEESATDKDNAVVSEEEVDEDGLVIDEDADMDSPEKVTEPIPDTCNSLALVLLAHTADQQEYLNVEEVKASKRSKRKLSAKKSLKKQVETSSKRITRSNKDTSVLVSLPISKTKHRKDSKTKKYQKELVKDLEKEVQKPQKKEEDKKKREKKPRSKSICVENPPVLDTPPKVDTSPATTTKEKKLKDFNIFGDDILDFPIKKSPGKLKKAKNQTPKVEELNTKVSMPEEDDKKGKDKKKLSNKEAKKKPEISAAIKVKFDFKAEKKSKKSNRRKSHGENGTVKSPVISDLKPVKTEPIIQKNAAKSPKTAPLPATSPIFSFNTTKKASDSVISNGELNNKKTSEVTNSVAKKLYASPNTLDNTDAKELTNAVKPVITPSTPIFKRQDSNTPLKKRKYPFEDINLPYKLIDKFSEKEQEEITPVIEAVNIHIDRSPVIEENAKSITEVAEIIKKYNLNDIEVKCVAAEPEVPLKKSKEFTRKIVAKLNVVSSEDAVVAQNKLAPKITEMKQQTVTNLPQIESNMEQQKPVLTEVKDLEPCINLVDTEATVEAKPVHLEFTDKVSTLIEEKPSKRRGRKPNPKKKAAPAKKDTNESKPQPKKRGRKPKKTLDSIKLYDLNQEQMGIQLELSCTPNTSLEEMNKVTEKNKEIVISNIEAEKENQEFELKSITTVIHEKEVTALDEVKNELEIQKASEEISSITLENTIVESTIEENSQASLIIDDSFYSSNNDIADDSPSKVLPESTNKIESLLDEKLDETTVYSNVVSENVTGIEENVVVEPVLLEHQEVICEETVCTETLDECNSVESENILVSSEITESKTSEIDNSMHDLTTVNETKVVEISTDEDNIEESHSSASNISVEDLSVAKEVEVEPLFDVVEDSQKLPEEIKISEVVDSHNLSEKGMTEDKEDHSEELIDEVENSQSDKVEDSKPIEPVQSNIVEVEEQDKQDEAIIVDDFEDILSPESPSIFAETCEDRSPAKIASTIEEIDVENNQVEDTKSDSVEENIPIATNKSVDNVVMVSTEKTEDQSCTMEDQVKQVEETDNTIGAVLDLAQEENVISEEIVTNNEVVEEATTIEESLHDIKAHNEDVPLLNKVEHEIVEESASLVESESIKVLEDEPHQVKESENQGLVKAATTVSNETGSETIEKNLENVEIATGMVEAIIEEVHELNTLEESKDVEIQEITKTLSESTAEVEETIETQVVENGATNIETTTVELDNTLEDISVINKKIKSNNEDMPKQVEATEEKIISSNIVETVETSNFATSEEIEDVNKSAEVQETATVIVDDKPECFVDSTEFVVKKGQEMSTTTSEDHIDSEIIENNLDNIVVTNNDAKPVQELTVEHLGNTTPKKTKESPTKIKIIENIIIEKGRDDLFVTEVPKSADIKSKITFRPYESVENFNIQTDNQIIAETQYNNKEDIIFPKQSENIQEHVVNTDTNVINSEIEANNLEDHITSKEHVMHEEEHIMHEEEHVIHEEKHVVSEEALVIRAENHVTITEEHVLSNDTVINSEEHVISAEEAVSSQEYVMKPVISTEEPVKYNDSDINSVEHVTNQDINTENLFIRTEKHGMNTEENAINTEHAVNTKEHVINSEEHVRNTEEHVINTEEHVINTEEHVLNTEEHVINTEEHVINTEEHVINTEEHALNTEEHVINPEHIINTKEHVLNTEEHVINTEEHVINTKEHALNTKVHVVNTEEHALNTEEHVINPEHIINSKEHVINTEEHVSSDHHVTNDKYNVLSSETQVMSPEEHLSHEDFVITTEVPAIIIEDQDVATEEQVPVTKQPVINTEHPVTSQEIEYIHDLSKKNDESTHEEVTVATEIVPEKVQENVVNIPENAVVGEKIQGIVTPEVHEHLVVSEKVQENEEISENIQQSEDIPQNDVAHERMPMGSVPDQVLGVPSQVLHQGNAVLTQNNTDNEVTAKGRFEDEKTDLFSSFFPLENRQKRQKLSDAKPKSEDEGINYRKACIERKNGSPKVQKERRFVNSLNESFQKKSMKYQKLGEYINEASNSKKPKVIVEKLVRMDDPSHGFQSVNDVVANEVTVTTENDVSSENSELSISDTTLANNLIYIDDRQEEVETTELQQNIVLLQTDGHGNQHIFFPADGVATLPCNIENVNDITANNVAYSRQFIIDNDTDVGGPLLGGKCANTVLKDPSVKQSPNKEIQQRNQQTGANDMYNINDELCLTNYLEQIYLDNLAELPTQFLQSDEYDHQYESNIPNWLLKPMDQNIDIKIEENFVENGSPHDTDSPYIVETNNYDENSELAYNTAENLSYNEFKDNLNTNIKPEELEITESSFFQPMESILVDNTPDISSKVKARKTLNDIQFPINSTPKKYCEDFHIKIPRKSSQPKKIDTEKRYGNENIAKNSERSNEETGTHKVEATSYNYENNDEKLQFHNNDSDNLYGGLQQQYDMSYAEGYKSDNDKTSNKQHSNNYLFNTNVSDTTAKTQNSDIHPSNMPLENYDVLQHKHVNDSRNFQANAEFPMNNIEEERNALNNLKVTSTVLDNTCVNVASSSGYNTRKSDDRSLPTMPLHDNSMQRNASTSDQHTSATEEFNVSNEEQLADSLNSRHQNVENRPRHNPAAAPLNVSPVSNHNSFAINSLLEITQNENESYPCVKLSLCDFMVEESQTFQNDMVWPPVVTATATGFNPDAKRTRFDERIPLEKNSPTPQFPQNTNILGKSPRSNSRGSPGSGSRSNPSRNNPGTGHGSRSSPRTGRSPSGGSKRASNGNNSRGYSQNDRSVIEKDVMVAQGEKRSRRSSTEFSKNTVHNDGSSGAKRRETVSNVYPVRTNSRTLVSAPKKKTSNSPAQVSTSSKDTSPRKREEKPTTDYDSPSSLKTNMKSLSEELKAAATVDKYDRKRSVKQDAAQEPTILNPKYTEASQTTYKKDNQPLQKKPKVDEIATPPILLNDYMENKYDIIKRRSEKRSKSRGDIYKEDTTVANNKNKRKKREDEPASSSKRFRTIVDEVGDKKFSDNLDESVDSQYADSYPTVSAKGSAAPPSPKLTLDERFDRLLETECEAKSRKQESKTPKEALKQKEKDTDSVFDRLVEEDLERRRKLREQKERKDREELERLKEQKEKEERSRIKEQSEREERERSKERKERDERTRGVRLEKDSSSVVYKVRPLTDWMEPDQSVPKEAETNHKEKDSNPLVYTKIFSKPVCSKETDSASGHRDEKVIPCCPVRPNPRKSLHNPPRQVPSSSNYSSSSRDNRHHSSQPYHNRSSNSHGSGETSSSSSRSSSRSSNSRESRRSSRRNEQPDKRIIIYGYELQSYSQNDSSTAWRNKLTNEIPKELQQLSDYLFPRINE